MVNSTTFTFAYTGTEKTRQYKVSEVPASAIMDITEKVNAINASLAAGTDGGLSDFFRSDDYDDSDPNNIIGKFKKITHVQTEQVTETTIF